MTGAGTSGFDLAAYLGRWSVETDRTLDLVLPPADSEPRSVHEAMRYSVFSGGKRLRPVLCVAGCEAVGGDGRKALRAGAAIEMIHAYSLIHDDLPAMDDDDLRRGRPTCHIKFGEGVAILAGDGLLTEAFSALASDPGLPAELKVRLVAEVSRAAGVRGMVSGQVMDLEKEGRPFTAEEVEFIHLHKTAAMISMSVAAGAMIGGGSDERIAALRDYGRSLGLAFQVVDDVLNVTGGRDLGKGTGTDAARGKATYPALFGVEGSRRRAMELCERGLESLAGFDERAEPLRALARFVVEREK